MFKLPNAVPYSHDSPKVPTLNSYPLAPFSNLTLAFLRNVSQCTTEVKEILSHHS